MLFKDMTEQDIEIWLSSKFQAEYTALSRMKHEMDAYMSVLTDSKVALENNSKENKELLAVFVKLKAFISVASMIGNVMSWVIKFGGGAAILWGIWTFILKESLERMPK